MNVTTLNQAPAPASAPVAKPRERRMTLAKTTRGPVLMAPRVLLYGTEGIGKSTFAAGAPSPIWIGEEKGTKHLNVERFPTPETWQDVLDAIQELTEEKHDFKTVVIDGLKDIEALIFAHLCAENNWKSIEELDYGKGYTAAVLDWRRLTKALERLHERRGMGVVLIGHSEVKQHKAPEVEAFDRHRLDINEKAAAVLRRLVDYVLFAQIPVGTVRGSDKRARGKMDSDVRVIHTQPAAAFEAKSRPGLPGPLPLEWSAFADARAHAFNRAARSGELRARIDALLAELGDETATTKTKAYLATLQPEDVERLEEVANKVELKIRQKETDQ